MANIDIATAHAVAEPTDAGDFFALGMTYSIGTGDAVDLMQRTSGSTSRPCAAHQDGARLRREIAEQMSDSEIGCAQRAARDWLKAHPQAARAGRGYPRRGLMIAAAQNRRARRAAL